MNSNYKVLIYSNQSDFLKELAENSKFLSGFNLNYQKATSLKMLEFLINEWSPHFCFIDSNYEINESISLINSLKKKHPCGVFSFSEKKIIEAEKASFLNGADHFAALPLDKHLLSCKLKNFSSRLFQAQEDNVFSLPIQHQIGEITILPKESIIKVNNQCVKVTPTQFNLLNTFANNHEKLLTRQWLKENVWVNQNISLRSIDAQISKLKHIVPQLNSHLINVYGKGYVFSKNHKRTAA